MRKVIAILNRIEASLNGSLDGLQLDNTADVIEKSLAIEIVNDIMTLVNEAQVEVKNIPTKPLLTDSIATDRCKKCNEPLHFAMGSLFCPNPKC